MLGVSVTGSLGGGGGEGGGGFAAKTRLFVSRTRRAVFLANMVHKKQDLHERYARDSCSCGVPAPSRKSFPPYRPIRRKDYADIWTRHLSSRELSRRTLESCRRRERASPLGKRARARAVMIAKTDAETHDAPPNPPSPLALRFRFAFPRRGTIDRASGRPASERKQVGRVLSSPKTYRKLEERASARVHVALTSATSNFCTWPARNP